MKKSIISLLLILSACSENKQINSPESPLPEEIYNLDTVNGISYLFEGNDQEIINLGNVFKGSKTKIEISIKNVSAQPTEKISAQSSSNYYITSSSCVNKVLAPNQSCSLTINFSSVGKNLGTNLGSLFFGNSSISITTNVIIPNQVVSNSGQLILLDSNNQSVVSPLSLGTLTTDLTLKKTFKLKNIGTASSGAVTLSLQNNNSGWYTISNSCVGAIIRPDQLCSFELRFSPKQRSPGVYSVELGYLSSSFLVQFTRPNPLGPSQFIGQMFFGGSYSVLDSNLQTLYKINAQGVISEITAESPTLHIVAYDMKLFKNKIYLNAVFTDKPFLPQELSYYDGVNVKRVNLSNGNHVFAQMDTATIFQNKMCFSGAEIASNGNLSNGELWCYDGETSPYRVDIGLIGGVENLLVYNGKLHFTAYEGGYAKYFSYNGSVVAKVSDVYIRNSTTRNNSMIIFNNKIYIVGRDALDPQEGLWVYNGNTMTRVNQTPIYINSPPSLTIFNSKLYFHGAGLEDGGVFEVNGANQVRKVPINKAIPETSYYGVYGIMKVFKNKLYIQMSEQAYIFPHNSTGYELWELGTTGNITLVDDSNPGIYSSITTSDIIEYKDKLYYTCQIPGAVDICSFDGVTSPQRLGTTLEAAETFTIFNDKIFFRGTDSLSGGEMWSMDDISPPSLFFDLLPGYFGNGTPQGSYPQSMFVPKE